MPQPMEIVPGNEDESLNVRLWAGVLIPPIAGGVNVVVGYIISNYDCNVHNRKLVLLVNLLCLALCAAAAMLLLWLRPRIESGGDAPSSSLRDTRRFLRSVGLWLSAGFAVLVLAGLVSTLTLGPCDL